MFFYQTWISIHTALAGCDEDYNVLLAWCKRFQSTQPSQAVTRLGVKKSAFKIGFQSTQPSQAVTHGRLCKGCPETISIHTALAGCDSTSFHYSLYPIDFNPHSPRRLWRSAQQQTCIIRQFQSTQPSQAVTYCPVLCIWYVLFQSTQPSQAVTCRRKQKIWL